MAWIKIFCVFLGTGKFAAIRLVFSIIIMIASSIIITVIVSSVIIVLIVSSIIASLPPPNYKNERIKIMNFHIEGEEDFVATYGVKNTTIYM